MKSRSRSRKIGKVVSVAAAEERRYGQIAGQSQRYLDEQLQRLGELNAYRHNYVGSVGGGSAVNSAHWKDYQNFLSRLDAAVGAQQQIVHNCEQAALTHRQQWLAKRQRVETLQRVLEKYRLEDLTTEARLEQKILDDLPNNQSACFAPAED